MPNQPPNLDNADPDRSVPAAAEVIRRLDKLWLNHPVDLPGSISSAVGMTVGRYVLERVIGRGAFGVVYKAHDPDLNRAVAIKIPRPDVLLDSDRLARFESEVQACARLDHPGIVPLYEADLSRAIPFMASAYCPGPNLQQWMDESVLPRPINSAVEFIEKVARAVQHAHEHGVIHRDLKPGNILLVPVDTASSSLNVLSDFQPRLTDFGLAQMTHGLHESQSSLIIGTPLYMSPEQAESRGDEIGPASDVFGLGAILYHLLTGVAPFAGHNYAVVLARLREETPVPVSVLRPDVNADLQTVCMKCLQRNPADRYASAKELADDLQRCLTGQPIQGRPMSLLQRIRRWSQQSARINEATLLIVVLTVIRIIFGPGALLMVLASPDVTVTGEEIVEIFWVNLLLIVPNDLFTLWLARRNLARHSSGGLYWLGFYMSVFGCVLMLLMSLGYVPSLQWYRRSLGARVLAFSLIALTFFVQSIAWYLADWGRMEPNKHATRRRLVKTLVISLPIFVLLAIPAYRLARAETELPLLSGPVDSIQLDGIDDMLTVVNLTFGEGQPFTLEAWIRPDKPHRGAIANFGPVTLAVVAAGERNRFRVHVSMSEERVYMLDTTDEFRPGRWTHVATTYDGRHIGLYVNGRNSKFDVSLYDAGLDMVEANVSVPDPLVIPDLWPGAQFMIGNLRQIDKEAHFEFSGRIGELRLNRSVFYHEQFDPEPNLKVGPDTALLLHLRDGLDQIPDATGRHTAMVKR